MSTLQEIIDDVISETRRTDRLAQITNYVRKSVKHAHSLADFELDRLDTTVLVTGGLDVLIGNIVLPADFRKADLVRPLVAGTFITGVKFNKILVSQLTNLEAEGKTVDTYYVTSGQMNFRSEVEVNTIGLIYFAHPDLSDLGNSTWITDEYSFYIKDLVKAFLFSALGDRENGNKLMADWRLSANDIVNGNATV